MDVRFDSMAGATDRRRRMAFHFKLGESFEEGFRRIALEQIERAQGLLQDENEQAVAVHETRKSLKRLRALLRLFRPSIGEEAFKRENTLLRDVGLSLSGARDRHVLLETANKLDASCGLGRKEIAEKLRQAIAAANGEGAPLTIKQATGRLAEAKKRLARLPIEGKEFDVVGVGLERSYRQGRRAFREAYDDPTDETFHEWRKATQQHWRQMALLSRAWPDYLDARAREARELSQILGDDHDLALLIAFAHSDAAAGLSGEQAAVIETVARRRQVELRAEARPRGDRLLAEGAGRLRRSIGAYWSAAAALKERSDKAEQTPAAARRQRAPRRRSVAPSKA